eukprot:358618_1
MSNRPSNQQRPTHNSRNRTSTHTAPHHRIPIPSSSSSRSHRTPTNSSSHRSRPHAYNKPMKHKTVSHPDITPSQFTIMSNPIPSLQPDPDSPLKSKKTKKIINNSTANKIIPPKNTGPKKPNSPQPIKPN